MSRQKIVEGSLTCSFASVVGYVAAQCKSCEEMDFLLSSIEVNGKLEGVRGNRKVNIILGKDEYREALRQVFFDPSFLLSQKEWVRELVLGTNPDDKPSA